MALKNSSSLLLFASPIFADTSGGVLLTAFEPSMKSRGAEIFWGLKQLFSFQIWRKTAKYFFYDHILGPSTEAS